MICVQCRENDWIPFRWPLWAIDLERKGQGQRLFEKIVLLDAKFRTIRLGETGITAKELCTRVLTKLQEYFNHGSEGKNPL